MSSVQRYGPLILAIIALTPLWLTLLLGAPSSDGGGVSRVKVAGIPAGFVMMAAASVLTLAGLAAVRSWTRPWAGIVLFTAPASLIVLLGPGVILIIENLGYG